MTSTYTERVALGAAWLDDHDIQWRTRINLDTFNIGDINECVLGQILDGDGYHDLRNSYGLEWTYLRGFTESPPMYFCGSDLWFDAEGEHPSVDGWDVLNEVWIKEITK